MPERDDVGGRARPTPGVRPTALVAACYVAYASVGWYLAGLGAILPELEDHIGSTASSYQLFPGIVLLVWGVFVVRRHRALIPRNAHASVLVAGSVGLVVGLVLMGVTEWRPISLAGAVAAATAATALIRLLPAALATARPADTERVLIRANVWSSLAGISAPIAIGASIGVGFGWVPGILGPIAVGGAVVTLLARRRPDPTVMPTVDTGGPIPSIGTWWREWSVLALCIVVEFCFAYYAATYLHEEVGLSTAWAAAGGATWGIGMALGRFALSTREPSPNQFPVSLAAILAGFVLMWGFPHPATGIAGIGIAGLGASPLYPMRMTALLRCFPSSPDQASARGSVASGAALLAAPALMVSLRAMSDVRTAYIAVPVLVAVLAVLTRPERATRAANVGPRRAGV